MDRKYSETDIMWSSIEKDYSYKKVLWSMRKNGIPVYALFGEDGNKIDIER